MAMLQDEEATTGNATLCTGSAGPHPCASLPRELCSAEKDTALAR